MTRFYPGIPLALGGGCQKARIDSGASRMLQQQAPDRTLRR
jgi:hypothetical protein